MIAISMVLSFQSDDELKQQALDWISAVIGTKVPPPFEASLKDGVILCEYVHWVNQPFIC